MLSVPAVLCTSFDVTVFPDCLNFLEVELEDPQDYSKRDPFIAQERSSESGLLKKALDSVFASECLGFSSDSDSVVWHDSSHLGL